MPVEAVEELDIEELEGGRARKRHKKRHEDTDAIANLVDLVKVDLVEGVSKKKEKKKNWIDPAIEANVDWAVRHAEKKKRKQERRQKLDEEAKAALKAKVDEKASREKANEKLKKKGKLTKKQKYLAAKAEKKAQAQGQKSEAAQVAFKLEDALAAANLTKLDPKAVSCFLTGLPYLAKDKDVVDHFACVGPCTVSLLQDPAAHRCNGTGFVTFSTAEHALHACSFAGSKIQGRWIKVRLCEPRDSGLGTSVRGPEPKPEGCLSAVIKCDPSISEASLKRFFSDCELSNVSRMMDRETGEFRGTAFLDFEDTAMVDKAVAMSGQSIKGHTLLVRYKAEKNKAEQKTESSTTGRVSAHNRAPPVPAPSGTVKTFDSESDSE